ncbi:SIR2 family NAD-dependent protein deacylase [Flavobacterium sp.]|uniref:SIR2 family NAD-dependent protein deacylase n=1 Tax=Flavobacterium sp. TaxID=239 RepID=UPI0040470E92
MNSLDLENIIKEVTSKSKKNKITFLTGAGISAESGLPTFRSIDGIWIKGTKYHKPEEFGTFAYFYKNPEEVWQYNLFWKKLIEEVNPNLGHIALAEIESIVNEKFTIITQNVDGLHQKAGSVNVLEIHGNKQTVRCSVACNEVLLLPKEVKGKELKEELTTEDILQLKCKKCGSWLRPNTLWFDEYYSEKLYKSESAIKIAKNTGLLFIVGTSGETYLPMCLVETALQYGSYVVEINIDNNTQFYKRFDKLKKYGFIEGSSSEVLQEVRDILRKENHYL